MTHRLALLLLLIGVTTLVSGQQSTLTTPGKASCVTPYEEVGGRCVFVDILNIGSWQGSRDRCYAQGGGDLVKVDSGDFYAHLVNHINGHGLPSEHYWIGATDTDHDGLWLWVDGTPVQMGTPFWAVLNCDPVQRPTGIEGRDCVYLDKFFNFYFNDWFCDNEVAYPICEMH